MQIDLTNPAIEITLARGGAFADIDFPYGVVVPRVGETVNIMLGLDLIFQGTVEGHYNGVNFVDVTATATPEWRAFLAHAATAEQRHKLAAVQVSDPTVAS